jgi:hypothetical protein
LSFLIYSTVTNVPGGHGERELKIMQIFLSLIDLGNFVFHLEK